MGWHGELTLNYSRRAERTVVHDRHSGPLRVLQSLYPEGDAVCHTVLVHPPGGIVGGDVLNINVALSEGAHALVTTPSATRFYRSMGELATQRARTGVARGARLEWLPLETIVYNGALAENGAQFTLEEGAEMIGWDVLALGLPASDAGFKGGSFSQCIELPGTWTERATIAASDRRLNQSLLGWGGQSTMGTLWFAAGAPLAERRRELLLDLARQAIDADVALRSAAGATCLRPNIVIVRALASGVETADASVPTDMDGMARIRLGSQG